MKRGFFVSAAVAACAMAAFTASADENVVLYDNFGPGDSFQTGSGWTIGSDPGAWVPASAVTMGSGNDYYLTSITAGVTFVTGTNSVTLTVYADAGGLPGAALESVGGSDFGPFGSDMTATKFDFAGTTVLEADETYWVGFETVNGPSSWLVWNMNDQGADLPRAYMNNSSGGAWVSAGTTTAGAMRIEGKKVPAPGALALLGVAGFVGRRRRRA